MLYQNAKLFPGEKVDHAFNWSFGTKTFKLMLTPYRVICVERCSQPTIPDSVTEVFYDAVSGVRITHMNSVPPSYQMAISTTNGVYLNLSFPDTAQGVAAMDDLQMKLAHKRALWFMSGR